LPIHVAFFSTPFPFSANILVVLSWYEIFFFVLAAFPYGDEVRAFSDRQLLSPFQGRCLQVGGVSR